MLIDYTSKQLSPYYDPEVEGYIVLRQVELNGKIIPPSIRSPMLKDYVVKLQQLTTI